MATESEKKALQAIYEAAAPAPALVPLAKRPRKPVFWLGMAASWLLLLGVGALAWYWVQNRQIEYTTAFGEVRTFTLADSSVVTLNANSTLRHRKDAPRSVYLEGEAFFDVHHTADDAPFTVHAGQIDVHVLGTEFNVNNRHQETEVVLLSGKVKLDIDAQQPQEILMEPNDRVAYHDAEDRVVRQVITPDLYTAWRDRMLVFDHTPLREIAQLLQDTYDLTLETNDPSLYALEFTAQVPADNTDLLLELLEKSFDISITRTQNTLFMRKNIRP